ncbi:MAG: chemotaxis protein CheW, partial [Chloroflexota bacterium]
MTTTASVMQFIFCNVGREAYAIDATYVVNIEKPDQLQPASPEEGQVGWFPTAGGGLPVYNLDQLLARSSKPAGDKQRVLLIEKNDMQWGLLVNSLSPIIE